MYFRNSKLSRINVVMLRLGPLGSRVHLLFSFLPGVVWSGLWQAIFFFFLLNHFKRWVDPVRLESGNEPETFLSAVVCLRGHHTQKPN